MSNITNNEINDNKKEGLLTKLNSNIKLYKIITYILIFLIIGGGLASIIMSSLIPVNPDGASETEIVKQFEVPYIYFVTYICMAVLGILLVLYIISVIYSFMHRGENK